MLGLLVLLSLALITVSFRESSDGPLHDAQGAVASVLQPLEVAVERVARPFRDAYGLDEGSLQRALRERASCGPRTSSSSSR